MANGLSLLSMGVQRYWSLHILLTSKKQNWVENASVLVSTIALAFVWIIPAGKHNRPQSLDLRSFYVNLTRCLITGFSVPFLASYKLSVYNCSWYPEVNTSAATIDPVHQHPALPATNPKFDFEEEEEVFSVILCHELPPEFGFNSEPAYCHLRDGKQTVASMIGVCDATGPESAENLYHITMGVIYAFITILFLAGFYFLHAARKAESKYNQLLPSTSLRNIELMHNIRMVLTSRRRGIRIIMFMLALFIVCKLPFWIFIVAGKSEFYVSRSSSMLGVYFALHWLGNFKATITAYVYAHSNNAFQSNDRSHYTGQRRKHTCSLPWRRHKASFFAMNDPI